MIAGICKLRDMIRVGGALILWCLFLIACAGMDSGDPCPWKSVRVGESFSIILEANPTTGYGWEVKFDPIFLTLKQRRFSRTHSPPLGISRS